MTVYKFPVTKGKEETQKVLTYLSKRDSYACPDYLDLKRYENHLLFVYGHLKTGGFMSPILKDAKYLGKAVTAQANWSIRFFADAHGFPNPMAIRKHLGHIDSARILGEAYAVQPEHILEIDEELENRTAYKRDSCFVTLRDQKYQTKTGDKNPIVKALIYTAGPFWEEHQLRKTRPVSTYSLTAYDWDVSMKYDRVSNQLTT